MGEGAQTSSWQKSHKHSFSGEAETMARGAKQPSPAQPLQTHHSHPHPLVFPGWVLGAQSS